MVTLWNPHPGITWVSDDRINDCHLMLVENSMKKQEILGLIAAGENSSVEFKLGVSALVALSTALLKKSVRGELIIVGEINLGGSIEPIHNPVPIAEIAVEKGATALLMPVACRRQLFDLSDDMATKIDIQFYSDAKDALLKAMVE